MTDQLFSALLAAGAGALVAVLLFVPFVFLNYRRHGRLSLVRTLLWIGFLVYAMALWTYTLLPLPDPVAIQCTHPQLRPFQFVQDIRGYGGGLAGLIHNPAFMQVALNVLLFIPLGVFLRLLWGRGVLVATVVGFCISLVIETTQLTGVWGIYPCPYRVFDVDDLLANTSGALLGAVLMSVLIMGRRRLVPKRAVVGEVKAAGQVTPAHITLGRRLTGMVCDLFTATLLGIAAAVATNAWQLYVLGRSHDQMNETWAEQASFWVPFVLIAMLTLMTGRTVGDHAVRLNWQSTSGSSFPRPLRHAGRFLAGIGGFMLLSLGSPADLLFALVLVVCVLLTKQRGGLPAVLTRSQPTDATHEDP